MDRRYCIRARSCLPDQSVRLSELSDPDSLARENVISRRLPVRQQAKLWTAGAEHSHIVSPRAEHFPDTELQVVPRLAAMGL